MMEEVLTSWQATIARLNERLVPIAQRSVDLRERDWLAKLKAVRPLDEAGIRVESEALLEDIVSRYGSFEEAARQRVRDLFRIYHSFAWAAGLGYPPSSEDSLRKHLILEAIRDQGRDARDAAMSLRAVCHAAHAAGIKPRPLLVEVAAISSVTERWKKWGSMRQLMLREASHWRWRSAFW